MPLINRIRFLLTLSLACVCLSYTGCAKCKGLFGHKCADIPKGAVPQPHGTFACQWQTAQMARAEQDDFAVYLYEWQGNDAELTRYGKDHLKQISKRLDVAPFPVVIERSDDGALDEVRRQSIVAALAAVGYEDADKRVVVGHPDAEPLHGLAAPRIGGGYLGAGGEGGTGIGSGSGGFGAGRGFGAGVGVGSAFGGF